MVSKQKTNIFWQHKEKKKNTIVIKITEDHREIPRKLRIDLSYGPAIPLLGLNPKKIKLEYENVSFTPTFIIAQFTITKRCNNSRCLLADD